MRSRISTRSERLKAEEIAPWWAAGGGRRRIKMRKNTGWECSCRHVHVRVQWTENAVKTRNMIAAAVAMSVVLLLTANM